MFNYHYSLCSRGRANNAGSPGNISSATESFSGLNLGEEDGTWPAKKSSVESAPAPIECKCGMPLCICEAPKPEPAPVKVYDYPFYLYWYFGSNLHLPDDPLQQNITVVSSTAQSNPRPKKPVLSQQKASTTSSSNSRYVVLHFQPSLEEC
jgi:hypothetical protein